MADVCETCLYWRYQRATTANIKYGDCRRYPPIPLVDSNDSDFERFPETPPGEWCGEYHSNQSDNLWNTGSLAEVNTGPIEVPVKTYIQERALTAKEEVKKRYPDAIVYNAYNGKFWIIENQNSIEKGYWPSPEVAWEKAWYHIQYEEKIRKEE